MFWQDVRYGIRVLGKSPGFTAIAVITLALGIGLNTALFSVVNAVLLQALPYERPNELVQVSEVHGGKAGRRVSGLNLRDWRDRNRSFRAMAGYAGFPANIAGGSAPVRTRATLVTEDFFATLAIQPSLGRIFLPAEQTDNLAVLSHGLWEKSFGGDARVLGRVIRMDGRAVTVIGVMPAGFDFPEKTGLWLPHGIFPDHSARSAHNYWVIGRLKPGTTAAGAGDDLNAISAGIRQQDGSDRDFGAAAMPLHEALVGRVRPAFLVLLGAVGFVLLIACVNVANLQLAKAGARAREMALRTALGAKQSRLMRQLLTENMLLALVGGGMGLVIALWGTDLLRSFVPPDIPRAGAIGIDRWVLAFTAAMSVVTGLLFGLLPALAASRTNVNDALKEGSGKGGLSPRARRLAGALVTCEIALAMVLLIGAGLLLQSFWRLQQVNPGFQTSHVLTAAISWPSTARSPEEETGTDILLYQRLFERLRAAPGIESAAATNALPIADSGSNGEFQIDGRAKNDKEIFDSYYRVVTPDYFRVLGIPLLRGRLLTDRDDGAAPWAAVVNETMARQFFPNEGAVGKRIRYYGFDRKPQWLTIAGVVADSRDFGLNAPARAICFTNYLQHPGDLSSSTLVVRASTEAGMPKSIAAAVASIDKDVPVAVHQAAGMLAASIARQRFQMELLLLFALLALGLAAIGIYGVLSYSVERRTAELGIRMALGAKPAQILRAVLGEGLRLAGVGLAIGIAGSLLLTRAVASFLFGVTATDPATFGAVAFMLAGVAMGASYLPARRATLVDPAAALRNE
jgi:predicted permease